MPLATRIIDHLNLVIIELTGTVTLAEMLDSNTELSAQRDRIANYDLLIGGPAGELDVESREIREFAAGDPIISHESRRVILATTPLAYGISRMYASSGQEDITVCDSMAAVSESLEIDVEKLLALCPDWPGTG